MLDHPSDLALGLTGAQIQYMPQAYIEVQYTKSELGKPTSVSDLMSSSLVLKPKIPVTRH